MDYYYDRKPLTTGFFEPVETNGIKLCDEYFVQINQDSLDLIFNYMFFNDYDGAFVDGVVISKDFIINGNTFILDGNHSARIFNITGDNTVFSNLTFRNGNATITFFTHRHNYIKIQTFM